MTVRVLVVDDHPVFRSGIVGILAAEDTLEVVGEASDGVQALALAERSHPDVVLMDLRMPGRDGRGMDGVEATERITATLPSAKVLVLTTYSTDADLLRAVEAGAVGYLLKDAPEEDLIAAILAAAQGRTVLDPALAARMFATMRRDLRPTPRELEVLALVAQGRSNAAIAAQLVISEATVKTHLLRVFAKLDVDDRTRAVMVALERGWLADPRETRG
jgi:DNA-binding NarL/FixJ family response regulator